LLPLQAGAAAWLEAGFQKRQLRLDTAADADAAAAAAALRVGPQPYCT
jgi:hypothetical protein